MTHVTPKSGSSSSKPTSEADRFIAETADPPSRHSGVVPSRLVEEHHVLGPHGENVIEATDERGRRWRNVVPEGRRHAD